jgi:type VI secretion system protein ImpH
MTDMATAPVLAPPSLPAASRDTRVDPLARFAFDYAESIEFFQLVRLLHRISPTRRGVADRAARPDQEVARFAASSSLAFPLGDVARLDPPAEGEPPRMVVNFMGLTGPEGVLPLEYTCLVARRESNGDTVLRDFLDIFNHRMVSLFYRAWEKSHPEAAHERGVDDPLSRYMTDLAGLAFGESRAILPEPQELLFYLGLLPPHHRSAVALEQLLEDYFDAEVSVVQFAGGWYDLDTRTQCAVGQEEDESEQLGLGAVVGDAVYDPQAGVRIRIGPLTRQRYGEFLPGGRSRRRLEELVRFFAGDHLEINVQLVLKADDVPPCRLGVDADVPLALGWYTWLDTSARRVRDPDDAVLSLQ